MDTDNLERLVLKRAQAVIKGEGIGDETCRNIARILLEDYGAALGVVGVRLWDVTPENIILSMHMGGRKEVPLGVPMSTSYKIVQQILQSGIVTVDKTNPDYDPGIEGIIGAENFIAIRVPGNRILSVEVDDIKKAETILKLLLAAFESSKRLDYIKGINKIASLIQAAIMSKEPYQPFEEFYDMYWFAKPSKDVGGDILDFRPLERNRNGQLLNIAISIGDSQGKGISAALGGLFTYGGLRIGTGFNPRTSVLVAMLNEELKACDITEQFMSLVYLNLNSNGTLTYVNAGHPPPWLIHGAGIKSLTEGGAILGAIADEVYAPGAVTMDVGNTLILYTDGLYEIENQRGEMLGSDGLKEMVLRHSQNPPKTLVERVIEETRAYMGKPKFDDDATLVAIRKIR